MANKVTMNICGQEYTLVADESAAYMEKVGALVDEKENFVKNLPGRLYEPGDFV